MNSKLPFSVLQAQAPRVYATKNKNDPQDKQLPSNKLNFFKEALQYKLQNTGHEQYSKNLLMQHYFSLKENPSLYENSTKEQAISQLSKNAGGFFSPHKIFTRGFMQLFVYPTIELYGYHAFNSNGTLKVDYVKHMMKTNLHSYLVKDENQTKLSSPTEDKYNKACKEIDDSSYLDKIQLCYDNEDIVTGIHFGNRDYEHTLDDEPILRKINTQIKALKDHTAIESQNGCERYVALTSNDKIIIDKILDIQNRKLNSLDPSKEFPIKKQLEVLTDEESTYIFADKNSTIISIPDDNNSKTQMIYYLLTQNKDSSTNKVSHTVSLLNNTTRDIRSLLVKSNSNLHNNAINHINQHQLANFFNKNIQWYCIQEDSNKELTLTFTRKVKENNLAEHENKNIISIKYSINASNPTITFTLKNEMPVLFSDAALLKHGFIRTTNDDGKSITYINYIKKATSLKFIDIAYGCFNEPIYTLANNKLKNNTTQNITKMQAVFRGSASRKLNKQKNGMGYKILKNPKHSTEYVVLEKTIKIPENIIQQTNVSGANKYVSTDLNEWLGLKAKGYGSNQIYILNATNNHEFIKSITSSNNNEIELKNNTMSKALKTFIDNQGRLFQIRIDNKVSYILLLHDYTAGKRYGYTVNEVGLSELEKVNFNINSDNKLIHDILYINEETLVNYFNNYKAQAHVQNEKEYTSIETHHILNDLGIHNVAVQHQYKPGEFITKYAGNNLRMQLHNIALKLEECYNVLVSLGKMHKNKIYHGDFKLENLVRNNYNEIKMIDFDTLSSLKDDDKINRINALGTMFYTVKWLRRYVNSLSQFNINTLKTNMYRYQCVLQVNDEYACAISLLYGCDLNIRKLLDNNKIYNTSSIGVPQYDAILSPQLATFINKNIKTQYVDDFKLLIHNPESYANQMVNFKIKKASNEVITSNDFNDGADIIFSKAGRIIHYLDATTKELATMELVYHNHNHEKLPDITLNEKNIQTCLTKCYTYTKVNVLYTEAIKLEGQCDNGLYQTNDNKFILVFDNVKFGLEPSKNTPNWKNSQKIPEQVIQDYFNKVSLPTISVNITQINKNHIYLVDMLSF